VGSSWYKKGNNSEHRIYYSGYIYALEQSENMADVKVDRVYVSIPIVYTKLVRNKGIIAVSGEDKEIGPEDIQGVLN